MTGTRSMKKTHLMQAVAGLTVLLVVLAMNASVASAKPKTGLSCGGRAVTITGTTGNDVIYGTPVDDVIASFGGDDTIYAGEGNDIICAGEGNNAVFAGPGDDTIYGGSGKDTIYGESGNDIIYGGCGADAINGGDGTDTLSFAAAPTGVKANLSTGKVSVDGCGYSDVTQPEVADSVTGIENINGSAFDDVLIGDPGNNVINGGGAKDKIDGKGGNDKINGVKVKD